MRPTLRRPVVVLSLAAVLSGCPKRGNDCGEHALEQDVLGAVYSYYLYLDLLPDPATISLFDYATADELLGALTSTAQAQGKDRGWSFLMSQDQYLQYFQDARSVGYGMSLLTTGAAPSRRVFVKQVFAASAADEAGLHRGDEILAAGPDAGPLTPVAGLSADEVAVLLSSGGMAGVPKTLEVLPVGGAPEVTRTMASRSFDLDPVPSVQVFGSTGYVQLRTFISAAEEPLRAAFASFKSQGVQDVVVDLRYNGGGSLDTAAVLADLLGGGLAGLAGQTMVDLQFNGSHPELNNSADAHYVFHARPESGTFQRVAFITTDASASASELVPNALDAYPAALPIAYVGTRTYGKPVGQMSGTLGGCNTVLFLIAFRLVNANGNVDYFAGLPDAASNGPLCGAADDLMHPQDSIDEASTQAAVYFAQHGTCPPAPAAARALTSARPIDQLGMSARTFAQRDMPGTF